ncbi:MAG: hypothetical protein QOE90_3558 [Thermoplasmata archaeon]|jgi:hypothetical protein|nr:hypothetical protein [Thermoplasmata archaeon]
MAGRRVRLPWSRRGDDVAAEPADAPVARAAGPLPRPEPKGAPHHWLTLVVARPGPEGPLPVPDARLVIRPYPRGAPKPGEAMARATTGPEGTASLHLPAGRYAISARHGSDGRAVTVTLEHAGRALLLLEALGKRIALTLEISGMDGGALPGAAVEVRASPAGALAARGLTDERGVATLHLPPGAYEVRVGETRVRTYVETDTLLRLAAEAVPAPQSVQTRYAQKARAATSYVAPFNAEHVRDDVWN